MKTETGDVNRRFIVTLFINDNTLMIYEPEVKNNGFKPGKFLERAAYKNIPGEFIRRRTFIPTS